MSQPDYSNYETLFKQTRTCVLIPTYNNAQTLASVIQSVSTFTKQVIVVNDGSTDNTLSEISSFDFVVLLNHAQNQGKGHALKTGFRKAYEQGYQYAITIDSDGQHFAKDLPVFIDAIIDRPESMIIGARNMDQAHIPGKSSFGNKFSNFWFWVETGITLPDTQSGYRLYPLAPLSNMRFFTRKYEFEIEVPVRLAWKHLPVFCVPVSVYYPPANERVSHFRPFKDFSRISVLNTFLTFIALLWIHPRNFFLTITSKAGWQKIWQEIIVRKEESNLTKAKSIGFGVFMGIVPVWGFQLAIGIPLSIYFKMNKALFLLAANVSIFPITPIFWALSLMTGKLLLGYEHWQFALGDISLQQFKEAGIAFFLGGTVLALILGLVSFLLSFCLLNTFRRKTFK